MITMNKNIVAVNDHLWLVNFDLIRLGYIDELKHMDLPSDSIGITDEGIVLIHYTTKNADYAKNFASWMMFLSKLKDKQLKENEAFKYHIYKEKNPNIYNLKDEVFEMYVKAGKFEYILNFLNEASIVEIERRKIEKDFKLSKLNPFKK